MENNDNQRASPENIERAKATKNKFNAGGNSSDYDGGHPGDSPPGGESQVGSGQTEQKENKKQSFNAGGNDSDFDGGHPKDSQ